MNLGLLLAAIVACLVTAGLAPVRAQGIGVPLAPPTTPNVAGFAFGTLPDYLGSDDYIVGAVPLVRYQLPNRQESAFIFGNALGSNVINHPWLRTGPTAVYRFGRKNPRDDVVARLDDVDRSLDVGWSLGAEYIDGEDPSRRGRVGGFFTRDVTGSHDGFVAGVNALAWAPTPFVLIGAYAGATWASDNYSDTYFSISQAEADASGLPAFEASSGGRDARVALVAVVPVTESILVGTGFIYSRLLGDAAESPVVADRGSANQFVAGVGAAFVW